MGMDKMKPRKPRAAAAATAEEGERKIQAERNAGTKSWLKSITQTDAPIFLRFSQCNRRFKAINGRRADSVNSIRSDKVNEK